MLLVALTTLASRPSRAQGAADAARPRALTSFVAAEYGVEGFNDATSPWQLASLSIGRASDAGSLIGRANVARRFGLNGTQFEADAYPRLSSTLYGYLNLGYSAASIFPTWRSGAELFASLPSAWEASVGYRYLGFTGTPVTLITGSVGRYVGNYWVSLRPYVRANGETSASANLAVRRYTVDADHYVGLRIGGGRAPSDLVAPDQVARVSSFTAGVQGSTGLGPALLWTWSLGVDRDELAPGITRVGTAASAGLKFRF